MDDVAAATDVISHRGPDDEGYVFFSQSNVKARILGGRSTPDAVLDHEAPYCPTRREPEANLRVENILLGHRRLSILDLSPGGHQPMCSPDQKLWVVFNGEVYNFLELRTELEGRGHRFISRSDTEVILAAFAEWGRDCLSRLRGMFAFLLFDREQRTLFVARDRFGIKPLYYWISPEGFITFASEIKQFTVLPGWRPVVNGQRVYDFLNWGVMDHTTETLFAGVFQVGPGEALMLKVDNADTFLPNGQLPTYRWYNLRPEPWSGSFEDAAKRFRELFVGAVRSHMQADVPVGTCLSGGLDSSSVVCTMNDVMHAADSAELQRTFSARSEVERFDEGPFISEVVKANGVENHEVTPGLEGVFDVLDRLTWHQDEPFGSTSIYAQWHVFQLAASHGVKVMLDGQGADEQLAGYHGYFGPHFADLLRRGRVFELLHEIGAAGREHGYPTLWAMKVLFDSLLPEWLRQSLRQLAGKANANPPWLYREKIGALAVDPFAPKATSVTTLSYEQLTRSNLQMLLHWEDRDSMAHSIEARVPFLDHQLVEFVLGLPDEFKLASATTKRVLREAMRDTLPETIRTRRDKLGFATPEEVWMLHSKPDFFRAKLLEAIELSKGILRPSACLVFDEMVNRRRPFSFLPWRMISFGRWMEKFGVAPP